MSLGGPSLVAGRPGAVHHVAGRGVHRNRLPSLLTITTVLALALSPLEGYLQMVNGSLGKVAPGLFLVTWAGDRVWKRRPIGTAHPVVAAVGVLFVVVLVTAVPRLGNGWSTMYVSRWLPYLVLCVALVDVITHDVHPRTALSALLTGASAAGGGALFSFAFLGDARATGPLADPNDLAYVLVAALPIVVVRLGNAKGVRFAMYVAAMSMLLIGAAATLSRGGALAIIAVFVWAAARRVVPGRLVVGGMVAVLVVGTVGGLLAAPQIKVALAQKTYIASTNIQTRQLRWEAALRMVADHPLLGVGPGGVPPNYMKYSNFAEMAERTPVTHEMYLEVAAELGLVGLFAFLGMILLTAVNTELTVRRLQRERVPDSDEKLQAAWSVQGSLIAVCVASSFLSEEYYLPLWAAIAIGAALEVRTRSMGAKSLVRPPRKQNRTLLDALLAAPATANGPVSLPFGISLGRASRDVAVPARPQPRALPPRPRPAPGQDGGSPDASVEPPRPGSTPT